MLISSSASQEPPIGTPCHPLSLHHVPMFLYRALRDSTVDIPQRHLRISSITGKLCAIGTPVEIEQGVRVASQDAQQLYTLHVPHTQCAIVTAAQERTAVRGEGQ